ncbi:MAG: LemA family protein [Candidatus Diapherotrites archaeon]|nr:LemA family protein [Candidatus Diapherotrites archaeon]
MDPLTMVGIALIVIVAVLVFAIIAMYNSIISLSKRVGNAWAQIDVQLKRRADLIPNLLETVKGYAKFEKSVLTEVTKARTAILSAKSPREAARGENMLAGALKSVFAVAEAYPSLKANENFIALQEELSSTENKVAFARQFYNDVVMVWNTKIAVFPSNIVASMFGMGKEREYFEVEDEAKKSVKVDFSDLDK